MLVYLHCWTQNVITRWGICLWGQKAVVELPNPLCFSGVQGHFPHFHSPLPCLHTDREMRQDSSSARGIPGSTWTVPSREGRCPRAEQLQDVQQGTAAQAEAQRTWEHPKFFQNLGIQYSSALSPSKNDSQRQAAHDSFADTIPKWSLHLWLCLLYPDVCFIQPVLWTWSLGCGTSVPIYPFLTSHHLKQPSLQQRYQLKLMEMYNNTCLSSV